MTVGIFVSDCREVLRTLPADSVHAVVTSPPYWGLRDYGIAGQIGLEPTMGEYVSEMVGVFREVRRVLRSDGTLWLNLGDSYTGPKGNTAMTGGKSDPARGIALFGDIGKYQKVPDGLKPKDLCGIPWRVAFALQADGWYLRQDIIWAKPNPMPESVTDRCTKSHEYLFLLSKTEKYYFDQEAILEDCSPNTHARLSQNLTAQIGSERAHAGGKTNGNMKAVLRKQDSTNASFVPGATEHSGLHRAGTPRGGRKLAEAGSGIKSNDSWDAACCLPVFKRNKRSVWEVGTQPFSQAHFATFPPALIEPCILAGCPIGGTVLDPFAGAGTTGLVADRLQRDAILIELNPEYALMADRRIVGDAPLLAAVISMG
jgi:DNA modification methylase